MGVIKLNLLRSLSNLILVIILCTSIIVLYHMVRFGYANFILYKLYYILSFEFEFTKVKSPLK